MSQQIDLRLEEDPGPPASEPVYVEQLASGFINGVAFESKSMFHPGWLRFYYDASGGQHDSHPTEWVGRTWRPLRKGEKLVVTFTG